MDTREHGAGKTQPLSRAVGCQRKPECPKGPWWAGTIASLHAAQLQVSLHPSRGRMERSGLSFSWHERGEARTPQQRAAAAARLRRPSAGSAPGLGPLQLPAVLAAA